MSSRRVHARRRRSNPEGYLGLRGCNNPAVGSIQQCMYHIDIFNPLGMQEPARLAWLLSCILVPMQCFLSSKGPCIYVGHT